MIGSKPHLRLHQELLLIALRDESGVLDSRAGMAHFALGGAILTELLLEERVALVPGKKGLVELASSAVLHDEVLDEALALVAKAKRRRRAYHWVSKFAYLKGLRARVARGLCRQGILEDSEDRVLLIFKRKVFPTIDPAPERRLIERLRRAIETDEPVDPGTATLVALLDAAGLLSIHLDRRTIRRHRTRIERMASDQRLAEATRQAVQAAHTAVAAATVAATAGATTAGT